MTTREQVERAIEVLGDTASRRAILRMVGGSMTDINRICQEIERDNDSSKLVGEIPDQLLQKLNVLTGQMWREMRSECDNRIELIQQAARAKESRAAASEADLNAYIGEIEERLALAEGRVRNTASEVDELRSKLSQVEAERDLGLAKIADLKTHLGPELAMAIAAQLGAAQRDALSSQNRSGDSAVLAREVPLQEQTSVPEALEGSPITLAKPFNEARSALARSAIESVALGLEPMGPAQMKQHLPSMAEVDLVIFRDFLEFLLKTSPGWTKTGTQYGFRPNSTAEAEL